ncbi:MAG TPA: hypothetical protein VGK00_06060 [Anaerolineales bacterium]|jgi:hypothetical protein
MSKQIRDEQFLVFLVGFLTLLGGYLRISLVSKVGFPVNDGGLFYSMTQDLIANGFRLPVTASYNGIQMAYVYPPLSFYLAGGLASIFHLQLIDIYTIFPALITTLTIPAFFLLAKDLLNSNIQTVMAVFFFTFLPTTYDWLIMGGGITRASGVLFSLLALWAIQRLYRMGWGWKYIPLTSLFTAAAILSHPEAALHTVVGLGVFFLFFGLNRRGIINSVLAAAGTLLMTAPWWVLVLQRHGLAPILAASQTGGYRLQLFMSYFQISLAGEAVLTFAGCLGIIGIFAKLAKKEYFFPTWILVTILAEPRSANLRLVPIMAMLAGFTLHEIILAWLWKLDGQEKGKGEPFETFKQLFNGRTSKALIVYLLVYYLVAVYSILYQETHELVLSPASRNAFEWIRSNLQTDGRFAVITGDQPLSDPVAEWFPALTRQMSVATVQGYEWVPGEVFNDVLLRSYRLQLCAWQDAICINDWRTNSGLDFDYVFLDKARIRKLQGLDSGQVLLQKSMTEAAGFKNLHETEDVALFQVVR